MALYALMGPEKQGEPIQNEMIELIEEKKRPNGSEDTLRCLAYIT
jgi:hypothetical protein